MAHTKITSEDLQDKGVVGLPDTPQYTASQMQEKFDEIALDVIVPKFNDLSDEIDENDTEVDSRLDAVEEPVFDEAETRENIESGSAISIIFGKIKKFFSDLKTVAFTGDYDDLTNKPVFPAEGIAVVDDLIHAYPDQALSANMGKELKAMVDTKQDSATAINTSNIASQSVSSATNATKATQDESGNNIKASYAADLTVSGTSVQLNNKNGQTIGNPITVPFATNATNATSATKATKDGSGNTIVSTYGNKLMVSGSNNNKIALKDKQGNEISDSAITVPYATNANSAVTASKLGTNAGSSSKPVYFSNGVPVACSNDIPSVVDNLTSDSTTSALSAKQGKALANGSARDNTKLPLSGGTITGGLTIGETRRLYIDANASIDLGHNAKINIGSGSITDNGGGLSISSTGIKANSFSNGNSLYGYGFSNTSKKMFSVGTQHLGFLVQDSYGTEIDVNNSTWTYQPMTDAVMNLGSSNRRWLTVFAQTGTINTSDRNLKKEIKDLTDKQTKDFVMNLKPVEYQFTDGQSGRTHYGLIAQDVEENLTKLGLTSKDFAGLCIDKKYKTETDKDGNTTEVEDGVIYGLRYEEFIAPLIKMVQMQQAEIDELKSRL